MTEPISNVLSFCKNVVESENIGKGRDTIVHKAPHVPYDTLRNEARCQSYESYSDGFSQISNDEKNDRSFLPVK